MENSLSLIKESNSMKENQKIFIEKPIFSCMTETKLSFPKFHENKVSTKTFIVMTNISLEIKKLFEQLPVTEYTLVQKRRGRKKKIEEPDPNKGIKSGSIITLEFENTIRGVDLKEKCKESKRKEKKQRKYFRNSVTIVIIIHDKKINFKVSRNGKFQITGCKSDDQVDLVIKYIWGYIKNSPEIYSFNNPEDTEFSAIFIPAMRNIDFSLGFNVNREELDSYINEETEYHSLLETSFGYTGVNIKIPIIDDIEDMPLRRLTFKKKNVSEDIIPYKKYLEMLPEKEKDKKICKKRFNTFLVFHSGRIIMSGICAEFQEKTYYNFLDIVKKCHHLIEEQLEENENDENIVFID
jgi:TATA-box binding protein (TBP) (component of TFIID and TFIIIB)